MPNREESKITINGVKLTEAQSMVVRVAVENLLGEVSGDPEMIEALGYELSKLYAKRLREVQGLIFG